MANRTRHGTESTVDDAQNAADAARLRAIGLSYRQIAERQGVSQSTAYDRVKRALAAVPVEAVRELRQVELERLDMLVAKAWQVLEDTHPYVTREGKVLEDLEDAGPVLQAITTLQRLSESRRKLLGLDAPTRTEITVTDQMTAEIERLAAELGVEVDS
jgi:predicted DNA-binding protein YlxM (UPF0122 family)